MSLLKHFLHLCLHCLPLECCCAPFWACSGRNSGVCSFLMPRQSSVCVFYVCVSACSLCPGLSLSSPPCLMTNTLPNISRLCESDCRTNIDCIPEVVLCCLDYSWAGNDSVTAPLTICCVVARSVTRGWDGALHCPDNILYCVLCVCVCVPMHTSCTAVLHLFERPCSLFSLHVFLASV